MKAAFARYARGLILAAGLTGLSGPGASAAAGGRLFTVELLSHGADTRVTLGLARESPFRATLDAASNRLLIDFRGLAAVPGSSIGRGAGLVRAYRAEPLSGGGIRLVFDLNHAAVIAGVHMLRADPGHPPRAVVELTSASAAAMRAAASTNRTELDAPEGGANTGSSAGRSAPPAGPAGNAPTINALIAPSLPIDPPIASAPPSPHISARTMHSGVILSSRRVIVVDAGHGGIDPGAPSVAGYHEKEVTLATARMLARVLEQTGRYKVVLTRDSDVFLKLHDRVALARAAHGNLFISLHADSIGGAAMDRASVRAVSAQTAGDRITRGASIYTLSENASDAESERYAQRENRADAIGGVALADQSDDVAGILVDLTVRETVNEGNRLAGIMAECLERAGIALLPRAPHRAAGFAVLKSPDIPSVLIEMGYLSDPADARALSDSRHQQQIAKAVAEGVDRYFAWVAARS